MFYQLMLFFVFIPLMGLADSTEKVLNGYDAKVDIISEEYEAGPFLIYDCQKKAWICVLEPYQKDCLEKRAKDVHDKKLELSCAFISELPNKKSCFQKQLFMASQNMGTRFCIGDDWKQKEMDL
jgi:hypothetical protein